MVTQQELNQIGMEHCTFYHRYCPSYNCDKLFYWLGRMRDRSFCCSCARLCLSSCPCVRTGQLITWFAGWAACVEAAADHFYVLMFLFFQWVITPHSCCRCTCWVLEFDAICLRMCYKWFIMSKTCAGLGTTFSWPGWADLLLLIPHLGTYLTELRVLAFCC